MKTIKSILTIGLILLSFACKKENDTNKLPSAAVLLEPLNASVAGLGAVVFKWQESQDAEGDDIEYIVCVSKDSVNWKTYVIVNNTTLTAPSADFEQGKKYYWKVTTENNFSGTVPAHEEGVSESNVFYFYTTPPMVSELRDSSGHQFVNLYWKDPENLDHVEITFTPQVSSIAQPLKINAGTGKIEMTGFDNGTIYSFFVKAYDKLSHVSVADTIKSLPLLPIQAHDADFNVYTTVTIGNQIWLAQNLRAKHYQDGTPIDVSRFAQQSKEGYGFSYDPSIALNKTKKIAPKGFHVASDEDWKVLELYIEMPSNDIDISSAFSGISAVKYMTERGASTKCGKALASAVGWNDYESKMGNGYDFYHFCIYPSGYSYGNSIGFDGDIALILTSTASSYNNTSGIVRIISNQSDGIYRASAPDVIGGGVIRCIKD
jgi:uncharacterized protein (TIGR02145 family)